METNVKTEPVEHLVGQHVATVERDLILATLRETGGNRTHAANVLGISLRTLRNKIVIYGRQGFAVPEPPNVAPPHLRQ